jgi:hypothetical protein
MRCTHGNWFKYPSKSCEICKCDAQIQSLKAEIADLNDLYSEASTKYSLAQAEIERLKEERIAEPYEAAYYYQSRARAWKKAAKKYSDALWFYGNPETYFAIGIFPDPPCGEFIEDFSDCGILRMKPGKLARETLKCEVTPKGEKG